MQSNEKLSAALVCLESVVGLLKADGMKNAGRVDGLLAYQALSRIKSEAEVWGLPLADIGLESFDVDQMLQRPKQAA